MKHVLLALCLCLGFFATAQTVTIPDPNFKTALLNHSPVIDTNGDGEIQVSEAENVSQLFVGDSNINSLIGIDAFENLTFLSCFSNQIEDLDISQNPELEVLYCSDNELESLDVSQNLSLIEVSCERNQLAELDVGQNLSLEKLFISENNIENIDLSNNENLEKLFYRSNPVNSIDLTNNINLRSLTIDSTQIASIDLSENLQLFEFTCDNTPIINLDLTSNIDLHRFGCNKTQIASLDLSQNIELYLLQISNTPITSLDLSNNPNLCSVYVESNFNLEYINLQNGNNILLDPSVSSCPAFDKGLLAANNPNLKFICVDDVALANIIYTETPPQTAFVEDCSLANGDLNTIEGIVQYDADNDGCDSNDIGIKGLLVNTSDGTYNFANRSTESGNYTLTVSENTYTTTVLGLSSYFTVTPSETVDTFTGFNQSEIADFCISPAFTANDLAISIIPTDVARPGFETTYTLTYENVGTTTFSGDVTLEFDESRISFVLATPPETSQVNNTIIWNYNNLHPFETKSINVEFSVLPPPTNQSGDILNFTATANPVNTDETPDDNVFELNQEVVNSLDPNDKQVAQGGQVLIDKADDYLHYIVRFQNTGTASAVNVRVQDNLDELLDWTTLKILDASHEMNVEIIDGKVDFIFNNIDLPTEDTDPEGSQGYVAYKIKPLSGIAIGDVIENTASIYFDFNPAIITNTVSTTYVEELGVPDYKNLKIKLYPNPVKEMVTVEATSEINKIEIFNVLGQLVKTKKGTNNKEQISVSELNSGNYFVKVITENGIQTIRLLKE